MAIYRGCYFEKDIQFKSRTDGQPLDITAWQFDANLKDEAGNIVLPMSTGGGQFAVTDGPNGWMRFALSTTQTNGLTVGPVTFALYRTDAAQGRTRMFRASEQVRDQD